MIDTTRRGQLAAEALGNPAVQDALKAMREDIAQTWGACPARDLEGREHCWRLFKSMEKFEALLKAYVESGKADSAMLQRKQTPLEAVRSFVA